ncbi:P22 phage major capsid protein family protein [Caloramator sp. CAR-1]|uniref:P22 phage major capsid protein family protein n=1 Tax=Caloramator sp. CAR-1 TaxID=3062777 RepID=UPI0026E28FA6|nr:P22 phage major capsid protein family protein [Caloramator sp. CAR-1]MDO6355118.1 P22 phage major capsid protein family protein [Caloramator sp. CAR-1]
MSLNNFIPQIWSARLLENLRKNLVFGQAGVVNRDYEGEIRAYGDTVKINSIGPVTVADYTKNTDINPPETLSDAQRTLVIDQAKYFNFLIDDIDAAQQNPKVMDAAMAEAAYALADKADQYLASMYVYAGSTIGNDTTPIIPTASTAYEYLVDAAIKLDENNIPRSNRWVIIPPWFYGLLLKDDRFVKAGTATSDQVLRNGEVGQAAGFTVYLSNNVANTSGTKYKIMAGHPMAITFAEQINKVEAYRPEKRFADAVKGLHLYGAKVIRPEALVVITANKS